MYQRLAVQGLDRALVRPEVVQFSVTGLIVARDHAGTPHALVGRRSEATRIYGSLWELGPSGGIDPPPRSVDRLDGLDVFRQLVEELREETCLPADPDPGPLAALTFDDEAMSCDAVMVLTLSRPIEELVAHGDPSGWEYEAVRWVPCARFDAFVRTHPCIPPTAALAALVQRLG
jgi:hypothetical protein